MFRAALVRRSNMYAVGRFISQGVYTVSGPFHPFGGAVDIIVVQQQDGSYKSSPWYVKFGKFQGVLKRSEKVVNIAVNDEALKFHMFLDSTGEAYFLKDAEPDEGSSSQRAITSGDEVLLLEDGPSKSEDGLESKAAEEDVEKGESSDEKDSNLALRFEGRKASYLLVQQAAEAQSAEARAAKELKIAEVRNGEAKDEAELPESSLLKKITDIEGDAEFSESSTLKEDTYITREAELPGSSTLKEEKDTVGEAELPGSSILKEENDTVGETELPGSSILKKEKDIVGETELPGSSILKEEKDIVGETELPGSTILKEEKDIVGEIGVPASVTLKEEKDIVGEAELPGSSTLKEENDIVGEAELPGSITLKEEVDIVGVASDDLLSSLAALKSKNTCLEELENGTGGSAIHSLLNRSVGLEESQQVGRPSCSLLAQAALGAVSKAAWEAGSEDSAKILGNGCRESLEIVNNSGEVIAEGFRLRRSKSLSLGSEQVADELVQVRRIRSESDLRLLETDLEGISSAGDLRLSRIKDTSPEPSTLTITSADGVVVLHTPRRGSPPPLIPQEDLTQTLQQPIILEGDGSEKPLVLGMVAFEQVTDNTQGDTPVEKPDPSPAKKEVGALITASGGWNLWPFPLRRTRNPEINGSAPVLSREALIVAGKAAVDSALVNNLVSERDYYLRSRKNKVRSFLPTSQMLSTMNLKEGSNRITFTFYTRVLGRQQVDARIYLWKWNTRVVISDVDGTITKSDVLGQVMPLVGRDWTQSGVTRLFSAIKENGYEVMFLSARAISQAYLTRQFLLNLKQDGEALPDGPVVISPDGLFPSLYREVIRRAPHEFKIACLQDIRDLFPEDCNPFYAGFGNRDTDEISYLKVGIPKGKIFIINPKGEVAVNNRVDVKSYTSLHKLVDDMFPPQTSTEQEDFNSWNYWKMPLPDIEDELSVKSASKPKKTKS